MCINEKKKTDIFFVFFYSQKIDSVILKFMYICLWFKIFIEFFTKELLFFLISCWFTSVCSFWVLSNMLKLLLSKEREKPWFLFVAQIIFLGQKKMFWEEWVNGFPPQLDSLDLVIYTDGSKMNSGSGVVIYSEEINLKASESLGEFASVFQTEIVAITHTAREILHINLNNKKIAICSDSQAAIKALGSFTSTSKAVTKCKELLSSN